MAKSTKSKAEILIAGSTLKQIDLMVDEKTLKEIVSGEIKEVYRNLTRYNTALLTRKDTEFNLDPRTDVGRVRFTCGFEDVKFVLCEINGIFLDEFIKFVPKGMKPGTMALTIEIRQIIDHNL